jgi:hypothetical protein
MNETETTKPAPQTVATLREPINLPDQRVDFFTERGFKLAQRLASAFATSNAVPAQFRSFTEKKGQGGAITYVENQSAMGNCLVAIETANAVGMSITAVMQQANVIEGRLSWSGKFIIAAINASHRFTPLRFDIKNLGPVKAKYKEKQGWNDQKRGFDFIDREVEIENLQCTAWAYTMEGGRPTKERIEGAPVSMMMAVEEGWYSKPGSKWQTSMKHLMLQYRAGSFFGNIHAPDVVMGMGKTTEEIYDTEAVPLAAGADGAYVPVDRAAAAQPDPATDATPLSTLRKTDKASATDVAAKPATTETTPPAQAAADTTAVKNDESPLFGNTD